MDEVHWPVVVEGRGAKIKRVKWGFGVERGGGGGGAQ